MKALHTNFMVTGLLLCAISLFAQGDIEGDGDLTIGKRSILGTTYTGQSPLALLTSNSDNYATFNTTNGYIGYAGVFNGNLDMDFGTGAGNTNGNVHLVTNATPRLSVYGFSGFVECHEGLRLRGNADGTAWTLGMNGDQIIREGKIHIIGKTSPSGATDGGIMYRKSDDTHNWLTVFIEGFDDYDFMFDGVVKAWISDVDGSYSNVSDINLKQNVDPIDNVLSRLMKLTPSRYQFKSNTADAPYSIGLIAQEVRKLFPEVVSSDEGRLGIAYSKLAVIAIKAIQEQQAEIEALRALIEKGK